MPSLSLHDLLGIYDIRAFGVDPSGNRDSSPGFRAAMAEVAKEPNNTGCVIVPPGKYKLDTDVTLTALGGLWILPGASFSGAGTFAYSTGVVLDMRAGFAVNGAQIGGRSGLTAAAAILANRLVGANRQTAAVGSTTVIGAATAAAAEDGTLALATSGVVSVTADAPLAAGDAVKVGSGGRVTKHSTAQTTIEETVTGAASSFAAPSGLSAERLSNVGFETAGAGGADVFGSWVEAAGDGAIADETTAMHGGAHAAKLTAGATPASTPSLYQEITPVVPGHGYNVSFWTKGDGSNAGRWGLWDATNEAWLTNYNTISTGVTGDWYEKEAQVWAPAGCLALRIYFFAPAVEGGIAYFDDVSIESSYGKQLEAVQAADVEADRGRYLFVIGATAEASTTLTLRLGTANTTLPPTGASSSVDTVAGIYVSGTLGAQDVTIRLAGGGPTVCVVPGEANKLAADVPSDSREAYSGLLSISGPNGDESYVTIAGKDTDNTSGTDYERLQFNGASPAIALSTKTWRYIDRICMGEFTNAAEASVKTAADAAGAKCGVVVTAAAARGDSAQVLIKPNA